MRPACFLVTGTFCLSLLLLMSTPRAQAQVGVYGEFSASDFNVPNTNWQYGTTFGLFYNRWTVPFFGLGLDGRGAVVGKGTTKAISGLAGPRLTFKPHVLPVMPYVEALVGAGDLKYEQGIAQTNATKLEYQFLGGLDWTIFPRVDWRLVEFSYGGFSGSALNPRTLSTGIVVRLP